MAVSIFILILSLSITSTNTFLDGYRSETGKDLIGARQTAFINNTDMGLGTTQTAQNTTMNKIANFDKPQDEAFQYDFWKSVNTFGIITEFMYFATWGFPQFMQDYFSMPAIFTLPMIILINISHILFGIYLVTGRTF